MAAASAVGCLAGAVMLEVSCPGEDGSFLDTMHTLHFEIASIY